VDHEIAELRRHVEWLDGELLNVQARTDAAEAAAAEARDGREIRDPVDRNLEGDDRTTPFPRGGDNQFLEYGDDYSPPLPEEVAPLPFPSCSELPDPWAAAYGARYPFRFKPTGPTTGQILVHNRLGHNLPLATYRGRLRTHDGAGAKEHPIDQFDVLTPDGAVDTSGWGTGVRRFYLVVDMTAEHDATAALSWRMSAEDWNYIFANEGDLEKEAEIVPVLEIETSAGSIVSWDQIMQSMVMFPANA
jgi:hypothetical protein